MQPLYRVTVQGRTDVFTRAFSTKDTAERIRSELSEEFPTRPVFVQISTDNGRRWETDYAALYLEADCNDPRR